MCLGRVRKVDRQLSLIVLCSVPDAAVQICSYHGIVWRHVERLNVRVVWRGCVVRAMPKVNKHTTIDSATCNRPIVRKRRVVSITFQVKTVPAILCYCWRTEHHRYQQCIQQPADMFWIYIHLLHSPLVFV